MIRFHSFYAAHSCGEYTYLMNDQDMELMDWVRKFNEFDLYSKTQDLIDVEKVKRFNRPILIPSFYQNLIKEFLPYKLKW